MVNNKKIAFITCVNDEVEYGEARYYIDRLYVPDGYETDMINVDGAPSMAAGYNAGMQSTDAKYKVYLHQDTFIVNRNFITDMLKVFESDERIGMLGCVGASDVFLNGRAISSYDTGRVYHNSTPRLYEKGQRADGKPTDVEMVDGLLIATQTDVEWREDLFDGWDYYDVSSGFEMIRAGFRVVVPYQERPWCFHDNAYSKMTNYEKYCGIFVQEYRDIKPFEMQPFNEDTREMFDLMSESFNQMVRMVESGDKKGVREMMLDVNNRGYQRLRQFEILADIDAAEDGIPDIKHRFWTAGDTWSELKDRIALVRFAVMRKKYNADEDDMWGRAREAFGQHVVDIVTKAYNE